MYSSGSQPEQAKDKQEEPDPPPPPPPPSSASVSVTPSRRSIFKAASARKRTMRGEEGGEGRREDWGMRAPLKIIAFTCVDQRTQRTSQKAGFSWRQSKSHVRASVGTRSSGPGILAQDYWEGCGEISSVEEMQKYCKYGQRFLKLNFSLALILSTFVI